METTYFNYYGCEPPQKDCRDYHLSKAAAAIQVPEKYSALDKISYKLNVKNQQLVSSCVAHAVSSILEYYCNKTLSTQFIYGIQKKEYNREGKGMIMRNACGIVKKYGDMIEADCPGNTEVPEAWSKAEAAYNDATKLNRAKAYRIKSYAALRTPDEIKAAIYQYGPVLASIKWYNSYFVDFGGILKDVKIGTPGYHAVMVYGWNEKGFLCQNSWGNFWGKNGRFVLPYSMNFEEAFSLVDDETDGADFVIPKRNAFLDWIYKIINTITNFFSKLCRKD